jgi:4-carboxymuconolactone decarboxylase
VSTKSGQLQTATTTGSNALSPALTSEDVRAVSPALDRYTKGALMGDLWKRPDLSPRDRSIVTVAVLIARNQTIEMPYHFNLALDNGVRPGEISEIITHLAFYSGWANAMSAVAAAKDVFGKRSIGSDQLPPASGELLPIDDAADWAAVGGRDALRTRSSAIDKISRSEVKIDQ